jgi:glycosyltransferase involved in cell wall biosynthesis
MTPGSRPAPPGAAIVHVVREPEISGSQRVALAILADPALAAFRRVVVSGSASLASPRFIGELARLGVERVHVESLCRDVGSGDLGTFREFLRILRDLRPVLVHTHSAKPFFLAGLAAAVTRVPRRVHTLHGISFHRFTPPLRRAAYCFLEQVSTFFYHCVVSVNRHYERFFPLARARDAFEVIPNGIDLPAAAVVRTEAVDEFPVLFVGRLDAQKDPLFVIEVAKSIGRHWKSGPPPRFYIAGDGPLAGELSAAVEAAGLQRDVVLLGWVTDLAEHYARAKTLFLPSRWEACGLVLIEAAARGGPSVATRVEGVPEFIRDGENGLLFDQGDVEAACRQLARLADEPRLHAALAGQARADARHRDAATMVTGYRDLYRRLGLALP